MKTYLVKWEIEVEASSHQEAAKQAHLIFCKHPTVGAYHVRIAHEKGRTIRLVASQG